MKKENRGLWISAIGLVLSIGFTIVSGCGKGNVPNSSPDEIESAKFDAEKAENPNPMGASIPPN